jgi:hypothetical protein
LPFHDHSPARAFPSFKGQRNFTGLLWCETNARLVGYESWLERDHLLALDFDPAIVDIPSQQFRLDFELDGCVTPETMRHGWSEAVSMAASALPYQAMRSIDPRLQNAAAKPIIMPETIVCDHGKAYISHTFKNACRSLGISFQPAHPDTPTNKPVVARTLQSVGTLFAQYVTGYLGSSEGAITRARARLPSMVTAAFYFATTEDQATLLDYLGEPDKVTLHPWPVVRTPLDALSREEALAGPASVGGQSGPQPTGVYPAGRQRDGGADESRRLQQAQLGPVAPSPRRSFGGFQCLPGALLGARRNLQ